MTIAPLRPGDPEQVAGHRIAGRLGEGGQGTVFLAYAPDGTPAAVKMLHARLDGDERARALFEREAAAARHVASFCTARVLACDVLSDVPYMVIEYIEGPSLAQAIRDGGPMRGDDLHRLAVSTATALVAVHSADIAHRDFKPANILMSAQGPRVVDFGIAKAMDVTGTATGRVMGTPPYMAPEQVAGERVGPAADVFAWGSTVVFAATGHAPFGEDTLPAVFNRILTRAPDLGALNGVLRDVVAAALHKDPAQRPTADDLLHRLLHNGASRTGDARPSDTRPTHAQPSGASPRDAPPRSKKRPWRPAVTEDYAYRIEAPWAGPVMVTTLGLALLAAFTALLRLVEVDVLPGGVSVFAAFGFAVLSGVARVAGRRTVRVRVTIDSQGLAAVLDGSRVRWAWRELAAVGVLPVVPSGVSPVRREIMAVCALPRRAGASLTRLPARRLPRRHLADGRHQVLLPLGERGSDAAEIVDAAIQRHARDRWITEAPHAQA